MNEYIEYIKKNYISLIIDGIFVGVSILFLWAFFVFIYNKIFKKISENKNYKEMQREMVTFASQQVDKQINSRKYLPNTYIEVTELKEQLRFFCHPLLFYNKLIDEVNRLDFCNINEGLSVRYSEKIIIPPIRKDRIISFSNYKRKIKKLKDIVDKNLSLLNRISKGESLHWKATQKLDAIEFKRGLLESRFFLILDDAGQGKTNLICDLMNCFLLRLNIPSVLFFGSDFNNISNDEMLGFLSKKIARYSDYNYINMLITKICKKRKKHFIILIDALNECSNPNFPAILNNYIIELLRNEFVKIILTCRTEYYNLNFTLLENSSFSASMKKIKGINSRLEEHEKDELFRSYLNFFNIKWTSFSGTAYERLVDNFLLLRIFCEAYQGQDVGAVFNVYMLDLFDNYYRQIRNIVADYLPDNATLEKIICAILNYMIQNKIYRDVPLQKIVELTGVTKDIMNRLIDENVFFRRDILNQAGVLLDVEVASFSFDEFLNEEVLPQKILFEGVSKYLFFFSKKVQGSGLEEVLEKTPWYSDKYIQYIFQTNEDHLSVDDIAKVKKAFLTDDDKAKIILEILIHYRFDTSVYKRLNITLLYDILVELNENDFDKKFLSCFEHESRWQRQSGYGIKLDHYFTFVSNQIDKDKTSDPALELLFFLMLDNGITNPNHKARHLFDELYRKSPPSVLQIIQKYQATPNQFFRSAADRLYKKYF
jgi:hypothetical protein